MMNNNHNVLIVVTNGLLYSNDRCVVIRPLCIKHDVSCVLYSVAR